MKNVLLKRILTTVDMILRILIQMYIVKIYVEQSVRTMTNVSFGLMVNGMLMMMLLIAI